MDIPAAITAVATLVSKLFSRAWGDQTRDQSAIDAAIKHAREKKSLAFEDLRRAKEDDAIHDALRSVNYWDRELSRLYHEAAAKWP